MHALIAIALALAVAVGFVPPARAAPGAKTEPLAFYVNYAARVPTAPLVAHALSIVHPDAAVDLAAAHRAGNTVLAYLSVGEVAADAPYRADVLARRLPFAGRNATWNSDLVDLTDPRWADFFVTQLAPAIVARGFDGFFLDTLDSIELAAGRWNTFYPAVLESILHGTPAPVPCADVIADLRVLDAARQSADTGATVHLSPQADHG